MSRLEKKFKEITVFADLSSQELTQLTSYLQPFSAAAGTRLISQAATYSGLYIILSGNVQVWLKIFGGGELNIASLKEGDIFGEMALISNYTATSSVIAETEVTGLLLTPSNLHTLAIIHPQLSDKLKQAVALRCCQRSRQLLQHIPDKVKHQQVWPMPKLSGKSGLKKAVDSLNHRSLSEFLKTANAQPLPIPFFSTLSEEEIDFLSSLVHLRFSYRGEDVQNAHKDDHCFYWLLWGAVQAVLLNEHMVKVTTYGPGNLFGTIEYVDKLAQPYRYAIREDALYFSLDEAAMALIQEKAPILWGKIMQSLWASVGAHMTNINWIFLQLNAEDVYQVGLGVSHV